MIHSWPFEKCSVVCTGLTFYIKATLGYECIAFAVRSTLKFVVMLLSYLHKENLIVRDRGLEFKLTTRHIAITLST